MPYPTNSKAGKTAPAFHFHVLGSASLRDYFASQALATCTGSYDAGEPATSRGIAEWCYRVADAMMKVREVKNNGSETLEDSQYHGDYLKQ